MITIISKKFLLSSFLFTHFLQPSKSVVLAKDYKNINNQDTNLIWSKISNKETLSSSPKFFDDDIFNVNLLQKNLDLFLVAKAETQQELIIQSDKQSEINDVIYAEGNVSVAYKGKLLRADNLIYDKLNKKISAKGNISLELSDQLFKAELLELSLIHI